MAQINKPNLHFNTLTWTGDGGTKSFTGVGFQPDFVWSKARVALSGITGSHFLFDSARGGGAEKELRSDSDAAEGASANQVYGYVSSFDSDGFTTTAGSSNNNYFNESSKTYVSWNWKANGAGSANTDGSINSTVSVNTTAGFSIVTWTGNGTNDATIGHGLGVAPKMIIIKNTADTVNWRAWHTSLSANHVLFLNNDQSEKDPAEQGNGYVKTVGTSTFSTYDGNLNDEGVNGNGDAMIAYCFAEKKGYSKFDSYKGNGNANGTFVYTGFRPAWVMSKRIDSSDGWRMRDAKRDIDNPAQHRLLANASDAEVSASSQDTDFLSNGFKIRNSDSGYNASGGTYIYMAFAENPIVGSNNIPATAR